MSDIRARGAAASDDPGLSAWWERRSVWYLLGAVVVAVAVALAFYVAWRPTGPTERSASDPDGAPIAATMIGLVVVAAVGIYGIVIGVIELILAQDRRLQRGGDPRGHDV